MEENMVHPDSGRDPSNDQTERPAPSVPTPRFMVKKQNEERIFSKEEGRIQDFEN